MHLAIGPIYIHQYFCNLQTLSTIQKNNRTIVINNIFSKNESRYLILGAILTSCVSTILIVFACFWVLKSLHLSFLLTMFFIILVFIIFICLCYIQSMNCNLFTCMLSLITFITSANRRDPRHNTWQSNSTCETNNSPL